MTNIKQHNIIHMLKLYTGAAGDNIGAIRIYTTAPFRHHFIYILYSIPTHYTYKDEIKAI